MQCDLVLWTPPAHRHPNKLALLLSRHPIVNKQQCHSDLIERITFIKLPAHRLCRRHFIRLSPLNPHRHKIIVE